MTEEPNAFQSPTPDVFPIMGSRGRTLVSVPWAVAEAAREQAEINHCVTLQHIARMGGMTAFEMLAALNGEKVTSKLLKRPLAEVEQEVRDLAGAM